MGLRKADVEALCGRGKGVGIGSLCGVQGGRGLLQVMVVIRYQGRGRIGWEGHVARRASCAWLCGWLRDEGRAECARFWGCRRRRRRWRSRVLEVLAVVRRWYL